MLAILGSEEAHERLHEISDTRRQHLICWMTGAFAELTKKKSWFKRYAENWVKYLDLKSDVELRELYAKFVESGSVS